MDTKFFLGAGLAIVLVFCSAAVYSSFTRPTTASVIPEGHEILYQVSTIDALMQGVYDGVQPVGEIKKHGGFGISTFDALEGEMIVIDGVVYQAKSDGRVYSVPDNATTPFATVTYFEPDFNATTGRPMNFSRFSTDMSTRLPSQNMIYVGCRAPFPT
jgi:acetolactate decarboxylase